MIDHIKAISLTTYRESMRSRVLYLMLFFAGAIVLVATLFGTVTIGDQIKVIKDFGLGSISLISIAYAVISGGSLLHKELSRKTVYNILAKPVSRSSFLIGKYLGLLSTTSLMVILMSLVLSFYVALFEGMVDLLIFQASFFMILELMIICAAAILFSSIVVTPILSGIFSLAIFLAGRSSDYLLYFVEDGSVQGFRATILKALSTILPPLDRLYIANATVFGNSASIEHMLWSFCYALAYSVILLVVASIIFQRREFN